MSVNRTEHISVPMSLLMSMHRSIHSHACTQFYGDLYAHVRTHVYRHMSLQISIHMCRHTSADMRVFITGAQVHMRSSACMSTHVYMHILHACLSVALADALTIPWLLHRPFIPTGVLTGALCAALRAAISLEQQRHALACPC